MNRRQFLQASTITATAVSIVLIRGKFRTLRAQPAPATAVNDGAETVDKSGLIAWSIPWSIKPDHMGFLPIVGKS